MLLVQGLPLYAGVAISTSENSECVWWELLHLLSHQHHGSLLSCSLATAVQTHWKPQLCSRSLPDRAGLFSCAWGNNLNLSLGAYTQGKAPLGSLGRTTNRQGCLPQHSGAKLSSGLSLILGLEQDLCKGTGRTWVPAPAQASWGSSQTSWCSQTLKERRNWLLAFL